MRKTTNFENLNASRESEFFSKQPRNDGGESVLRGEKGRYVEITSLNGDKVGNRKAIAKKGKRKEGVVRQIIGRKAEGKAVQFRVFTGGDRLEGIE